jgi:hypothetical protein
MILPALCADARGEATVQAASSRPVRLRTLEQSAKCLVPGNSQANGQTSEGLRRHSRTISPRGDLRDPSQNACGLPRSCRSTFQDYCFARVRTVDPEVL